MPKKKPQTDYAAELQKEYDRWTEIYTNGCSDPFWPDSTNLELIRNHLIYYRRQIEESMRPGDYPAIYFKELPPEVDRGYMARQDEIRAAARASLARYKADPDYQYILRHQDDFNPKTKDKLRIDAVLGYVSGLEQFIAKDDLVSMRRHQRAESYLGSFEDCARRMRETPREEVQMSLFSASAGGDDEPDDEEYDEGLDEDYGGISMM